MATSDFRIFANGQKLIGEETLNIAPLDDEQLTTETKTGFYSGLASSKKFNRVLRQGTAGTTTIADLIVDVLAEDVKDDGTTFKEQLRRAITKTVELDSKSFVRTINGKAPDASGDAVGGDTLNAEVLAACDKALTDTVQTTGQTELAQVMSAVAGVETLVDTKVPKSCPYVIEAWAASDKTSWYRRYSDGYMEQGGYITKDTYRTTLTFPTPFAEATTYTVQAMCYTPSGQGYMTEPVVREYTASAVLLESNESKHRGFFWYACGF